MGWTFIQGQGSIKEIEIELRRIYTFVNSKGKHVSLGDIHNPTGERLPFVVWCTVLENGELSDIVCILIERHKAHEWGYSQTAIYSGPFYYSCPQGWVDAYQESDTTYKGPLYKKWLLEYSKHGVEL